MTTAYKAFDESTLHAKCPPVLAGLPRPSALIAFLKHTQRQDTWDLKCSWQHGRENSGRRLQIVLEAVKLNAMLHQ